MKHASKRVNICLFLQRNQEQTTVKRLTEKLGNALPKHTDESERNAIVRAICCDILGINTTAYYLKEDITLTPAQEAQLNDITERLKQGEPLQYIEGKSPFCGMTFSVTPAVLIPRPETAELVEWIATDHASQNPHILDLGTGSGCIAIALSQRFPAATIDACDISPDALAVAMKNGKENKAQVLFFLHDMLNIAATLPHSYHILVSNPPYIKQSEASDMEQHVTEWEPHTALFVPDNDALRFYHAIAKIGQTNALQSGGHIYVEINQALGKETAELFESYGYKELTLRKDIYGNDRMIKAVKA